VIESSRYPVEVFYSDDDGGFIAIAKDLPGCSAFGKTQAKAIAEIQHAIKAWQEATKAAGNLIPPPSHPVDDATLPSGKILLRVPRTVHAALIECAKKEAISLNQHLVSVLSASVGMTLVQQAQQIAASVETQRVVLRARQIAAPVLEPQGVGMQTFISSNFPLEPVSFFQRAGTYIGPSRMQTENIIRPGRADGC
jgi:predicted RNase H-like HicB family nuclease